MATNLISSYNSYNFGSNIYSPWGSYGQIGGVASEVSLISDLVDSPAEASAEAYYLCMPSKQCPVSESLMQQIQQELTQAFFIHKTLPFFSLHFNQKGFLYPVIHPAYISARGCGSQKPSEWDRWGSVEHMARRFEKYVRLQQSKLLKLIAPNSELRCDTSENNKCSIS